MKNNFIILLCFISILTACHNQSERIKSLNIVDSLLDTRPDSSLLILENIPLDKLNDDEYRARYALLLTQAKYKNRIIQTNDSIIKIAVDFYDEQKDTNSCYRAFLILGDAYFKTEQYDSSIIYINKSMQSLSYATKAGAYLCLADISKIQGNVDLSLEMERLYSVYLN